MRIAVVGSRNFSDYELLKETMLKFTPSKIVSGGAKGADTLAENYAREYQIDTLIFKPDYKKYGRVAPIIRNATIIDNANIVVAFWNGKSKGTKNAIDNAKRKMKVVKIILT
ncbi:MAG: DUF2493 domain-containing protein [Chlorobium sp.]|nr:DUF2493 domain-containing protein [Chlorobium sp.]